MTRQGREPPCVCEVTYPTASRITFTVTTGHHDVCEYIEYAWLVRFVLLSVKLSTTRKQVLAALKVRFVR